MTTLIGDLPDGLRERIGAALGWTAEETTQVDLQTLQALLGAAGETKLAHEVGVYRRRLRAAHGLGSRGWS